jgi:hypothetical protein
MPVTPFWVSFRNLFRNGSVWRLFNNESATPMEHLPLRRGLFLLTTLILTPLVALAAAEPPPPKPNIVFLFADDLGWGDLRCYGHPYAQTPHLDKLAAEGTRFTQCYATGVTCCPSRTGFMTSQLSGSKA